MMHAKLHSDCAASNSFNSNAAPQELKISRRIGPFSTCWALISSPPSQQLAPPTTRPLKFLQKKAALR
jgi:hypothetical protein